MPTKVHFINVGHGNMTLLELANGTIFLYDCNVTNENRKDVLGYLGKVIGKRKKIDVFVCSHRDSDHMRGVKKVHISFPIQKVWDSGVRGITSYCTEDKEYMELRSSVGFSEIEPRKYFDYGNTRLRVMNSKNDDLADNANAQSIVIKVVHRDKTANINYASVLLTGDTDAATWKNIRKYYDNSDLSCSFLLASHHGSLAYFDDPSDPRTYYTTHLEAKKPSMTIVSVGDNPHGLPDTKAIEFYKMYSTGSNKGNKVYRTDTQGNMCVTLKDGGGWSLSINL